MTTEAMKKQLQLWYPWWNLNDRKPHQIASMYQFELSLDNAAIKTRYIAAMKKEFDLDKQSVIWNGYMTRLGY